MPIVHPDYSTHSDERWFLHIGVLPARLLHVLSALSQNGHGYVIDGDGWNTWGEAIGADRNDGVTLHVLVLIEAYGSSTPLEQAIMQGRVILDLVNPLNLMSMSGTWEGLVGTLTSTASFSAEPAHYRITGGTIAPPVISIHTFPEAQWRAEL